MKFEDIKQEINVAYSHCCKNLLIANGFTIACASNALSSKNIIDKVHKYFKNRKSTRKIKNVEEYIYEVENQVIKQIYNSLPTDKIEQLENKDKIIDFLDYFEKYYTLNYDHILYKLLLMLNDKYESITKSTDGFKYSNGQLSWNETNSQNTYYLHGAFHLIKEGDCIKKVTSDRNNNLYNAIKNEWEKGLKSHVIISSDCITKKLKMTSTEFSPYLKYCFDSFKKIDGVIVTMGVSFSESDMHIVEAIKNNNNLKKLYLGWHTKNDYNRFKELFKPDEVSYKIEYYNTKDIFN